MLFQQTQHCSEDDSLNMWICVDGNTGRAKADPSQNMSYSTRDAIESPKTQAMCEQLQKKWPSLLGDGPTGCSWEWGTPRQTN